MSARQGNGCHSNALRPMRLWIGLHAASNPQRCPIVSFGSKVSTSNPNASDVAQWLKRHQMKCDPEFADGFLAVSEISRHPTATYPAAGQPGINRQCSFQSTIRGFELMQQYE